MPGPCSDNRLILILVTHFIQNTLFKGENEIKQVTIPHPRDFRNFPHVKTRNKKGPIQFFEVSKVVFFKVIQLRYNDLWLFSH